MNKSNEESEIEKLKAEIEELNTLNENISSRAEELLAERDIEIEELKYKVKHHETERDIKGWRQTEIFLEDRLFEIEKLKTQLEKAEKCLKFYANWANYKDQKLTIEDFEEIMFYWNFTELIGGKRAREYFKQKETKND